MKQTKRQGKTQELEEIGERIHDLRLEKGLSIKDLASKIDVSAGAISSYENGVQEMSIIVLMKLSTYFNTNFEYILNGGVCKKADNLEIHKRLGLDDEAIRYLEKIKKEEYLLENLNLFLGSKV